MARGSSSYGWLLGWRSPLDGCHAVLSARQRRCIHVVSVAIGQLDGLESLALLIGLPGAWRGRRHKLICAGKHAL